MRLVKTTGARLKAVRRVLGIRVQDAALAVGLSVVSVRSLEQDFRPVPRSSVLLRFAELYGVPVEWLLCRRAPRARRRTSRAA